MLYVVVIMLLLAAVYSLETQRVTLQTYFSPFAIETAKLVLPALLSGFVIAATFDVVLRADYMRLFESVSRSAMDDIIGRQSKALRHGLINVHQGMDYNSAIEQAQNSSSIFILQTAIPDVTMLERIFQVTRNQNYQMRIILCDPWSDFSKWRQKDLGRKTFVADAEMLIRSINKYDARVSLRLYDGMPACSIYAFGEKMFVGRFLSDVDAVTGFQLECDATRGYGAEITSYYNKLWEYCGNDEDLSLLLSRLQNAS